MQGSETSGKALLRKEYQRRVFSGAAQGSRTLMAARRSVRCHLINSAVQVPGPASGAWLWHLTPLPNFQLNPWFQNILRTIPCPLCEP